MTEQMTCLSLWTWGLLVAAALRWVPGEAKATTLLKAVTLAPLTGPGLLSVAWFFALLCGSRSLLIPIYVGLTVGFVVLSEFCRERNHSEIAARLSGWVLLPVMTGVILTGLSLYLDRDHGHGESDAMAIWNFAARFLFRSGSDYPSLMANFDPSHHFDYPLFVPAAVSAQWQIAGVESWPLIRWTHAGFILPFCTLSWEVLRFYCGPRLSALATSALMMTPAALIWSQRQYADAHLGYACLGAVGLLAKALSRGRMDRGDALATGLFLGAAPWLKNEGIPLVLLAGCAFLALKSGRHVVRRDRRAVLCLSIASLSFLSALMAFKFSWPPPNDLLERGRDTIWEYLSDSGRWETVLSAYGSEFDPRIPLSRLRWGGALLALPPLLILTLFGRGWRKDEAVSYLLLFMACACAGWILVYVLTPQELEWHLRTSMNRLILQILPTVFAGLVIAASRTAMTRTQ